LRFPESVTGDFYEACDHQREREKGEDMNHEPNKINRARLFS
jgi:hypothetical protein